MSGYEPATPLLSDHISSSFPIGSATCSPEWQIWGGFLLGRFWAGKLGKRPLRWSPTFNRKSRPGGFGITTLVDVTQLLLLRLENHATVSNRIGHVGECFDIAGWIAGKHSQIGIHAHLDPPLACDAETRGWRRREGGEDLLE